MHRMKLAGLAVFVALSLAPRLALAVSFDDCRDALVKVDQAFPQGMTDTWAEMARERLDGINDQTDPDVLNSELAQVWANYDAYHADPDPDGDGLAMAPEVVEAETDLLVCLYNARLAELAPETADNTSSGDDMAVPDDATVPENLERSPMPIDNPGDWFAAVDYPVLAARENRSGVTRFEVTVAADGKPLGCQATGPAGSPDLEQATCDAVMANSAFEPATDSEGNPVTGEYSSELRWRIPE